MDKFFFKLVKFQDNFFSLGAKEGFVVNVGNFYFRSLITFCEKIEVFNAIAKLLLFCYEMGLSCCNDRNVKVWKALKYTVRESESGKMR